MIPVLFLEPATRQALTVPDGPDLTRYFLACGGLVVLVGCLALGFKRVFARTLRARAARRSLRVLDVLPLGGAKRLVVVRCFDRVFLVGQGEKELNAIAELDAEHGEETPGDPEAGEPADASPLPADFASALAEAGGREVRPAPRRPVLDGGRGILG